MDVIDDEVIEIPATYPYKGNECTIYELNLTRCHWPLGPMNTRPPFVFCGDKPAWDGCPYCLEHAKLAYQPRIGSRPLTFAKNF